MNRIILAILSIAMFCQPSAAEDVDGSAVDVMAAAVGEVLAMDELCRWDFKSIVEQKFKAAAAKQRLTAQQQQRLRDRVEAEKVMVFGSLSPAGRDRMRNDICTAEARVRIGNLVTQVSFD